VDKLQELTLDYYADKLSSEIVQAVVSAKFNHLQLNGRLELDAAAEQILIENIPEGRGPKNYFSQSFRVLLRQAHLFDLGFPFLQYLGLAKSGRPVD
jgi:hypothetical protein